MSLVEAEMGSVHLSVTDRDPAIEFWRDVLGLTLLSEDEKKLRMGAGPRELVVLYPGAVRPVPRGTTGLYHLAILLPNLRELARVIARLFSIRFPNAPTDHVITQSTYLSDPDDNGIELYADTPERGSWSMAGGVFSAVDRRGVVNSGREPLDLDTLFSELTPEDPLNEPMPQGTKIGHVHVHVRDLDEAMRFYHEVIGFDDKGIATDFGMGMASAGGYHHHIGFNIWMGEGAPRPPKDASGLRYFTIEVPTERDVRQIVDRMNKAGIAHSATPDGALVEDPSGNQIRLKPQDEQLR